MKHINKLGLFGGSLLALTLLLGVSVSAAHAQTSTTTSSTATSTNTASTTGPVISSVSAASSVNGTGATISWLTDVNSNSQVAYGTTANYTASTTVDNTMTMNHTVMLTSLTPSTTYHFQVISANATGTAMSADQLFVTNSAATSTSVTVTDLQNQISVLQADINSLQNRLNMLWQELNGLINGNGGNTGGNTGGGTGTTASATIDPATANVPAGNTAVIDFGGRNFGQEETVNITLNGNQIGTAHADGGGNFSTGSMTVPSTAGTYTYTFTGAKSGKSASSVVTVH